MSSDTPLFLTSKQRVAGSNPAGIANYNGVRAGDVGDGTYHASDPALHARANTSGCRSTHDPANLRKRWFREWGT